MSGTFTKGETVTATKADSSTYTFNLTTNFGVPSPSTQGDSGIQGFLVPIKSTDGTLGNFQGNFKVYGREGKFIGNDQVVKIVQYGRSTFYCPKIQNNK